MPFFKKTKNFGFSIVEMLVVIAILGIMASSAALMFNGTRNEVALEDAQASVINSLERARSRAATGFSADSGITDHGVNINVSENTITSCHKNLGDIICVDEPNQKIDLKGTGISITSSAPTVIFNRLSGNSTDTRIEIRNINGEMRSITVTPDGIIEK